MSKDTRVSLSYRVPLNADFTSAIPIAESSSSFVSKETFADAPHAGKSYLYSEFIRTNPHWVPAPGAFPVES